MFLLSKFFQMFLSLRVLGFWSTVSVFFAVWRCQQGCFEGAWAENCVFVPLAWRDIWWSALAESLLCCKLHYAGYLELPSPVGQRPLTH